MNIVKANAVNSCGIYLAKYMTREQLDIPSRYKCTVEIIVAHDMEDGKYRYGVNASLSTSGFGFFPGKNDRGYDTFEEARLEAILRAMYWSKDVKTLLFKLGYITRGKVIVAILKGMTGRK